MRETRFEDMFDTRSNPHDPSALPDVRQRSVFGRDGRFDDNASRGFGSRRGRYVKTDDQGCSAVTTETDPAIVDLIDRVTKGEPAMRRGQYLIYEDDGTFYVYDQSRAILKGRTFDSAKGAAAWISSGAAAEGDCAPATRRPSQKKPCAPKKAKKASAKKAAPKAKKAKAKKAKASAKKATKKAAPKAKKAKAKKASTKKAAPKAKKLAKKANPSKGRKTSKKSSSRKGMATRKGEMIRAEVVDAEIVRGGGNAELRRVSQRVQQLGERVERVEKRQSAVEGRVNRALEKMR